MEKEKLNTVKFIVKMIIAIASALLGVLGGSEATERK